MLHNSNPSKAFTEKINIQQNPFIVPQDSAAIIWQRAFVFLTKRKNLIGGGDIQQNDSTILIPYSNSYYKGSFVKIEKSRRGDSVLFKINWWYSEKLSVSGSNEIALYMREGVDRYHYK